MNYGVPLSASFAMSYIFNTSDRYFIQHYVGSTSTGIYSVGYDLSKQTMWVIMMSVNLAVYPLVVRSIEEKNHTKAKKQLKFYLTLLVAISFPSAIGLAILAKPVSAVLLGKKYAQVALIIPFISIGALVAGLKSFYIDLSFQLSKRTWMQLWSVSIAAIVNIGLNFILIPKIGMMGAVYSSVICYSVDFIISAYLTTKCYRLPIPWLNVSRLLVATFTMSVAIYLVKPLLTGTIGLIEIAAGAFTLYVVLLFLLRLLTISRIVDQIKGVG